MDKSDDNLEASRSSQHGRGHVLSEHGAKAWAIAAVGSWMANVTNDHTAEARPSG